jgi:excisionase family DNA binding protein
MIGRHAPDDVDDASGGDRYLRLSELARYSGLAIRTLQKLIASPTDPLPSYRVGRIVLVQRSEFDRWLRRRSDQADQIQQSFADVSDDDWRIAKALRGYAVKAGG